MSTDLATRIRRLIRASRPIPVSDYMATCLFDPQGGYYATHEPFGAEGDFVTAPEISQMFGEIVGAWLVHAWRSLGRPAPFLLAEMGPGRGTLMRDILRTARIDPAFMEAARLHLIETSPRLRAIQRETLGPHAAHCEWHDDLASLPHAPLFLVANELFDAVPVRQIVKTDGTWRERLVGLDDAEGFAFVAGAPLADLSILPDGADTARDGAIFEFAPAREAIAARIGAQLKDHGGTALIVDYGHTRSGFADTLQALRAHRYVPVFETPGRADITSHVDFQAIADAAKMAGAHDMPVMTQGDFLLSLGLAERAGALGRDKDESTQAAIRTAATRLAGTGEGEMGSLFKVLCLTGEPATLPPFG